MYFLQKRGMVRWFKVDDEISVESTTLTDIEEVSICRGLGQFF